MKRFIGISILGVCFTPALCSYPESRGDLRRAFENRGRAATSGAPSGSREELRRVIYDPHASISQLQDLLRGELDCFLGPIEELGGGARELVSVSSLPSSSGAATMGGAGGLRGGMSLMEDAAGGFSRPKSPVRRVPSPSIDEMISSVQAALESAELELGMIVSSTSEAPSEVPTTTNPSASTTL